MKDAIELHYVTYRSLNYSQWELSQLCEFPIMKVQNPQTLPLNCEISNAAIHVFLMLLFV